MTSPNLRADICDPKTLAAMDQAFAAAWRMLRDDPFRDYASDSELRAAIGKKLLNLVADGVTDPLRLRNLTLESLLPRHWDARCSSNCCALKVPEHKQEVQMKTPIALTSILFLAAMLLISSAQAMSPPRLHQSDGLITQVRHDCGAGMRWNEALGRCATTSARRNVRRGVVTGN